MDFTFTEAQDAVKAAAEAICAPRNPFATRVSLMPPAGEWFDREAWRQLADAGLLALPVSEEYGGAGAGLLEACSLFIEVGRNVVRVPVVWTTITAMAIERFGSAEQRAALLPQTASGDCVLTVAMTEDAYSDGAVPETIAVRADAGWRLTGDKTVVPFGGVADRIAVPARTDDGRAGLFLLSRDHEGMAVTDLVTTDNEPQVDLALDGVKVADEDAIILPENGLEGLAWLRDNLIIGVCALQLGIMNGSMRAAADYTTQRIQFGRPVATFQAAAMKMADQFIDEQCTSAVLWQAAWMLAEGLPAESEVAIAKFWASEAGQRVTATTHHLHGGMGVDVDYPLHQYMLWSKVNELTLGSAWSQLGRLGVQIGQGARMRGIE
jgi:3-oxocholest-4-en-26-oyl-CoA dehydrogenase beta subunit